MSIKYLQDQQLNQVQQSPNNSPWAKLIAQSEMLERNKMRQPQGQAPQGTVAGNIQQQLMAAQEQEGERQNADLYKSQMLAQLIGSGQIPANFASQGYADGGLTQPSMQPGTGAYRGIMMPNQPSQMQGQRPTYIPPSSQDPNAQEKKHGILQTLLDNSMYSGKGTIDSNMQMYSDMLTGKLFSRGFAEGGDIRGFAAGGESMAEQLARIKPQIEATLKNQGWTKEAIDRYVSAYKPEMGRGFTNQLPATTAQPPSFEDMLNLQRQKAAQTGVGIKPFTAEPEPPHPFQQAAEERAARLREELQLAPHREAAEARAAKLRAIQEQAAGAQRTLPAPGPTSASSLESVLGKDANVQDFINSLKSKQLATTEAPASAVPEGLENPPAVRTGTGLPAETNYGKGATIDAPYFVHPNATPNADATAKSAWESADILDRAKNNWDKGQSTEAKAWLKEQADKPHFGANPPAVIEQNEWLKPKPGETPYRGMPEMVEKGLNAAKQGIGSLGTGAGKVLSAISPVGDLMAVHDVTGSPLPMLAKAAGVDVPSSIGGVPVSQGGPSQLAMDLMGSPTARLNQVGSGISDAAQYVGDKATSAYDQFKNRLNAPPSVPQTDISQFGVDTKAAIPQQPTIGDFSGSVTPQTKGPATNEKGVITNPHSANKHESTTANTAAINQAHGQEQSQSTSPVTQAVQQAATVAQADQAANRSSDTGMGQGSILDSLYSKLKDTDVDYSDLAKRISENEYDLARERKDGTFNAILGGVGAALSKAGSYEGVGDRVFRPGLGAIAGAGITGGLKMSAASGEAISKKSQDNMTAMLALKKLKRESMNDVLDAISAQKQTDVYAQSVANTALSHRDTAANNAMKNVIDFGQLNINKQMAAKNMEHLDAQIADLYNKASSDPNLQGKVNLAADKAKTAKDVLTSLINGMVQPSDPRYIEATSNFNAAFADLSSLGIALKIPTTVVAPNAGSSGANPRGIIVDRTQLPQ